MNHILSRGRAVAVATSLLLVSATPLALASPTTGDNAPARTTAATCSLERIGTQLVSCDNLTGNGVRAAAFIPEQATSRMDR